ncbi:tRNA synthetases class II core domain (F)-domain-containing protein [Syncephalis pseudoplumigaleata]|uniref:phenylalanine--tRNA ligase n=1 Tax=Syncephalis pseudoplumigaleata TaxID=1712513 RepID=A0A4P9YXQ9_9FUNG|nr:tRNA synthetases class II core domain (F)-domain-containing protein [Syncephalis pseudoplumigaleata]|eukprot:RKP23750.1 tRNA synthetases class II core domain (F)-domain-containing protein [Syncephalis pseudoplumigaleata]
MAMSREDIQQLVLTTLDRDGKIADSQYLGVPDQLELLGVLNSLASSEIVSYEPIDREVWLLTEEGREVAENGSHEAKVFHAVPQGDAGMPIAELQKLLGPIAKVGQGQAFKNKWIGKRDGNLVRLVDSIDDTTRTDLCTIRDTASHPDAALLQQLRRRKLCDKQKVTTYAVSKGPQFTLEVKKPATELTAEMLQSGEWKSLTFKKFNFDAEGLPPNGGYLHPLMKVREEFRQIFFEMGFTEMPSNRFVESSFWNFDALFQPQQHPARDLQDTFFLKDPAMTSDFPPAYLDKVRTVHSKGGFGSIGYGSDWKIEEAEKLLLRTHTTAVSANMLYLLAQQPQFKPVKYFSIDRVFRNETVDATHLAEFHQVEGVIADRNLTLGHLIGFMEQFFRKMGIENIVFKPTYNPYTEPSMEIFSYHEGLGKWVEVGNSGMFRPEMLLPMGLDPDVRVIAWGLSLERPTMIKYGIDNIRDLVGHKIDLELIQSNPICR